MTAAEKIIASIHRWLDPGPMGDTERPGDYRQLISCGMIPALTTTGDIGDVRTSCGVFMRGILHDSGVLRATRPGRIGQPLLGGWVELTPAHPAAHKWKPGLPVGPGWACFIQSATDRNNCHVFFLIEAVPVGTLIPDGKGGTKPALPETWRIAQGGGGDGTRCSFGYRALGDPTGRPLRYVFDPELIAPHADTVPPPADVTDVDRMLAEDALAGRRMRHATARAVFRAAFRSVVGRDATLLEVQAVQGVAYLETQYAFGWKGAGKGSWNFGAIQGGKPPCDPAKSFLYQDTHPNNGSSTPYSICFRKYPSAVTGAEDLVRVMYVKRPSVLAAAATGNLYAVSEALLATGYYEGMGATREQRIRNHEKALTLAVVAQARDLNEPGPPLPPRTLKEGMIGDDVAEVQRIVGATDDGVWGPKTTRAVKGWQTANGLVPDGVWGTKSRAAAGQKP